MTGEAGIATASVFRDDLFISLSKSGAGCYIGQQFTGAFGYAHDVILVAPSKRSLNILLETCKAFSSKYRVKYNPQKSKLIVFDNGDAIIHRFDFILQTCICGH